MDRQRAITLSFAVVVFLTLLTGYSLFPLFYAIGLVGGGLVILACEPQAPVSGLQSHEAVASEGFPGHCTKPSDRTRLDNELESFKSLIVRDYVASWYGRFAEPADHLEVKVLIDDCVNTLLSYFLRLDAVRLLCMVTEHFHAHYSACINARRTAQNRDQRTRNLHGALAFPPETEVRHNKSIAAVLLRETLPKHHQRNTVLIELLTEVLSLHVITPVVDMFAKRGFAHEVLWQCLSDTDSCEKDGEASFPTEGARDAADVSPARSVGWHDGGSDFVSASEVVQIIHGEDSAQQDVPTGEGFLPACARGDHLVETSGAKDELDELENPEEFVSEELAKYFKVAPEITHNPDSQGDLASCKRRPSDVGNIVVSAQSIDQSLLKAAALPSYELFTNVQVTNVQLVDDNCSVLYTIMYKAWYHRSDGSASALKSRTVKKQHQDLVILHHMLVGNAVMTDNMKAVGTPSWLDDGYQLTSEPGDVHELRHEVTDYLQLLTANSLLCNSKELRQFLEYDSGSFAMHVKPADVGIPRLNQVLAKTWSGVWDKMTRFGFESRPRTEKQAEETDKLFDEFKFGVALYEPKGAEDEDYKLLSALKQHSEEASDVGCPESVQLLPADDNVGHAYSRSSLDFKCPVAPSALHNGIHPHASARAILELGLQCLQHCNASSWVLHERIAAFVKSTLAAWLQKHLQELLQHHLSMLRLAHYVHLLHGILAARSAAAATTPQPAAAAAASSEQSGRGRRTSTSVGCSHYQKALSALRSTLPGFLPVVLGAATFDRCLTSLLDSFDDEQQNKHLIYAVMDDVVAELLAVSGGAATMNAMDER